jgi:hypothetical protein
MKLISILKTDEIYIIIEINNHKKSLQNAGS